MVNLVKRMDMLMLSGHIMNNEFDTEIGKDIGKGMGSRHAQFI